MVLKHRYLREIMCKNNTRELYIVVFSGQHVENLFVESSQDICLYFVCACRVVCDPARGADDSLGARRRFSRRRRRRGELARVFWPRRLRLLFLSKESPGVDAEAGKK